MVKRTGPTNLWVRRMIYLFEKHAKEKPLYGKLAEELKSPRRKKKGVNIWKINKYAKDGEVIVIPYKLLGKGKISKKVIIFAMDYSKGAKNSLEEGNIEHHYLDELIDYLKQNPKVPIRILK